jgi:hypothetical protein
MKLSQKQIEELRGLLASCVDAPLAQQETQRLNGLLALDPEAQQIFADYAMLDACLDMVWTSGEQRTAGVSAPADAAIPAVMPTFPILDASISPFQSSLGNSLVSYGVAAAVVIIGILAGWACQVPQLKSGYQQIANVAKQPASASPSAPLELVFVGRITSMVACHWADSHKAPIGLDRVALGRKYTLISGLVEITYDTGARVILQGPCTYQAKSKTSGYLAFGKLTARVEKKGEGGGRKAEENDELAAQRPNSIGYHQSSIINHQSALPLPPSALFSVRTPTALVTDLGTEFSVEVDKSGASRAHVYQGKVEVRAIAAGGDDLDVLPLGENESARVEVGKGQVARVVREPGQPRAFVREMPRRVPIKLFNTGVNLKAGDADPHWQLVGRSDDPKFRPRSARVVDMSDVYWVVNRADRSQWISLAGGQPAVAPDNVVYTFRTTFDLKAVRPSTAILHGRFAADNHVQAMRLNGHPVRVPPHGHREFGFLHGFSLDHGFVEGKNVLEIDVENRDLEQAAATSFMGLLVELEGSAVTAWPESHSAANVEEKQSKK